MDTEGNSSSSDFSSSSSESDEEQTLLAIQIAIQSTFKFFHTNEWKDGRQDSVNPREGVRDVLRSMRSTLGLFKVLTNFSIQEFNELYQMVCPTITTHGQSIGDVRVLLGRPSKLNQDQRLLGFLLYMKHDPTTALPSFLRNWCKSSLIDDQIFIVNSIYWVLWNDIKWPNLAKKQALASMVPNFLGCIEIIDGTLVKIRRPWKNPEYRKWFNSKKKMYCMNNVVIVYHHGLFIYVNLGTQTHSMTLVVYKHQRCMAHGVTTLLIMTGISISNTCLEI